MHYSMLSCTVTGLQLEILWFRSKTALKHASDELRRRIELFCHKE